MSSTIASSKLAEVLRLLLLARREADLADLGDAFDQAEDLVAEGLADLGGLGVGIFENVVQGAQRKPKPRPILAPRGCGPPRCGWIMYGSPDIRSWPLWTRAENT